MSQDSGAIAEAYLDACRVELRALKPGNVHVFADGHRMTVADFERSAVASAAAMARPGLRVGQRIHQAIRATNEAVGCNTNLGIVLLCAPLAAAALASGGQDLRARLRDVLAGLDLGDAEEAFAAIRLAAPAGLGEAEHDVRQPARITLLAAMSAARARDRIAAQYADAFHDVFALGVPRLDAGWARWRDIRWATTSAYLGFLAAFPDSHVLRKHGEAAAEELRRMAEPFDAELLCHPRPEEMHDILLQFDTALKARGLNPGTSADLTVASLFARDLARMLN
jgi:triphosphoribosyl-dephospho-CoA synthase